MNTRVYIAAPFQRHNVAAVVRDELLEHPFVECTAHWIDDAARLGGLEGLDDETGRAIAERNYACLYDSHVVIALTYHGEGAEMWVELGRAAERGIPIVWVGRKLTPLAYTPGITRVSGVGEAIEAVVAMKARAA